MASYIGEWDELTIYQTGDENLRETINPEFIQLWDGLANTALTDPAITLAFGENDKANKQLQWFASLLAESKVVRASGEHRWTVWSKLWPEALKRSGLCNSSQPLQKLVLKGDFRHFAGTMNLKYTLVEML